jgi:serine/threonine protein kinase
MQKTLKDTEHIHILREGKNPSYHITANHIWKKLKGSKAHYPKGSFKTMKRAENELKTEVARLVSHKETEKNGISREYHFLKKLSGNRGIVQVYDLVEGTNRKGNWTLTLYEEDYIYHDLFAHVEAGNPIPKEDIPTLAGDIIYGVSAAHANQIAIADIKPENVVLGDNGKGGFKAGLIDFNLAINLDVQNEITWSGTPGYTAPEKASLSDRSWDTKNELVSDIFSLGVTLYYLYFRAKPYWFDIRGGREILNELAKLNRTEGTFFPEPKKDKDPVHHLIWEMCQYNPEKRPTISQIVETWKAIG